MEKKFLLYLLYIALVDIRERSYENNDKASFWLTNLLHNVPSVLAEGDEGVKDAFERVCERVKHDDMDKWLETRMQEFYERYPEFRVLPKEPN
jgi:hypothetical protein